MTCGCFRFYLGHPVPLYCEPLVEERIRKSFDYAFTDDNHGYAGGVPQLAFQQIGSEPFELLGGGHRTLRLKHGPRFHVLGFRFGNVAYCTDTNGIPPESYRFGRPGRVDSRRTSPAASRHALWLYT